MAEQVLEYGQFIGRPTDALREGGFCFSELAHAAGDHVPLHTHADPHYVLILNGAYLTSARGAGGACATGSLIFNPPGTTHQDRFNSTAGGFFTVSLDPERYRLLENSCRAFDGAALVRDPLQKWLSARIHSEFRRRDALSAMVLEGMALELLGATARHRKLSGVRQPSWMGVAIELIRDRCQESLNVREIAAEVGVHPYHLSRCFRRFMGSTPGEFLRACRIDRALILLKTSQLSISQIALQCGYSDQSQFTRSFRLSTGTTPGRMRRDFSQQRL